MLKQSRSYPRLARWILKQVHFAEVVSAGEQFLIVWTTACVDVSSISAFRPHTYTPPDWQAAHCLRPTMKMFLNTWPMRQSSSSHMHFMSHNWSATKQCLHPQSVAEISRHSVLSGGNDTAACAKNLGVICTTHPQNSGILTPFPMFTVTQLLPTNLCGHPVHTVRIQHSCLQSHKSVQSIEVNTSLWTFRPHGQDSTQLLTIPYQCTINRG